MLARNEIRYLLNKVKYMKKYIIKANKVYCPEKVKLVCRQTPTIAECMYVTVSIYHILLPYAILLFFYSIFFSFHLYLTLSAYTCYFMFHVPCMNRESYCYLQLLLCRRYNRVTCPDKFTRQIILWPQF